MTKIEELDYLIKYCTEQQEAFLELKRRDKLDIYDDQVQLYQSVKKQLFEEKNKLVEGMLLKYVKRAVNEPKT